MQRNPINSSMLKSAGYYFEEKILEVEFKNGTVWQYEDVKEADYYAFITSKSLGKHFHLLIKDQYKGKKVFPED